MHIVGFANDLSADMRSPLSYGRRRSSASDTPAKLARSSSCSTGDHSTDSHRSSARSAARSISNSLFGCFTTPDSSKSSSNVFSDSSGASTSGSDMRRSIYGSSNLLNRSQFLFNQNSGVVLNLVSFSPEVSEVNLAYFLYENCRR